MKLIAQPTNQGPAMARNASLQQAQGRFIAFLDSDDWWLSTKLERQLDFMRRSGAASAIPNSGGSMRMVTTKGA